MKPTLSLAAVLMLGASSIAQAQEGPGGRMQGPSLGMERGAGSDMRGGGGAERVGPRGGLDGPSRADRFDSGASGRGDGDSGLDSAERPIRERPVRKSEGPNPDERTGPPKSERSGGERKDGSGVGEKQGDKDKPRRSSSDDVNVKDRKDRAEGKGNESGPKAAEKSQDDLNSKSDKAERRAKSASDGDDRQNAKDAADADKIKPADETKKAEGDRRPIDEVKKADISGDRKERVRSAFRETRDVKRRDKVDIDISIGRRLPRDWDFAPVPVAVVDVVPEYRGYVYVYAEDEYVICDPVTYEVVAVLPAPDGPSYAAGGGSGAVADRCSTSLVLNDEDREFILRSVQMTDEAEVANVTVGWSVPGDIKLRKFPEQIVSRNSELGACRYFVVDEEVAIVDPRDEKVVFLVEHE